MKKVDAINLNHVLQANSKNGKMGLSKVTLVMMLVKLGKVQEEFDTMRNDVVKRLKEDYEKFDERLEKALEYERLSDKENEKPEWTESQYKEFMEGDYKALSDALNTALQPELEKEVDVDFKKFDAQGYSEWMESNNIDSNVAAKLATFLLEM